MKLEKFKEKNNKKTGIIIFTVCCVLLIAGVYLYSSFAIYEQNQNFNVINGTVEDPGDLYFAFYVDDVISKTMPSKDSGYVLDTEKSSCTNGATPLLNMDDWSLEVQNLTTTHTKCTLYFKESTPYDECVSKYGADSIQCSIIADVDTEGCPTVNDDGMVQVTREESENGYLCSAPDDYGTSYYYRGSVTNNYVSFAGYYWRIIRINGDGSIRLLYAGETADATGNNLNMKLTDSSLGYSNRTTIPFNTIRTDPAYVGYMYGNTLGTSYEQTNANEVDSNIKKYLDSWYRQNILEKGYADYIADAGFCNDRSLSTVNNNGDGVSTSGYNTYYGGYQRYYNLQTPSLVCPNESNDLFTTSSSDKGNKKLTYPIGLITVDELALSGYANNFLNKSAYTYSSSTYWTMSPSYFHVGDTTAYELILHSDGYVERWLTVTNSYGVRAVINLKSDTQISGGIGTSNDPFVVGNT